MTDTVYYKKRWYKSLLYIQPYSSVPQIELQVRDTYSDLVFVVTVFL